MYLERLVKINICCYCIVLFVNVEEKFKLLLKRLFNFSLVKLIDGFVEVDKIKIIFFII